MPHRGTRLRMGGDDRKDRTYSLDEEYDDDEDLDRKVGRVGEGEPL